MYKKGGYSSNRTHLFIKLKEKRRDKINIFKT